jgi:hypothetical protein
MTSHLYSRLSTRCAVYAEHLRQRARMFCALGRFAHLCMGTAWQLCALVHGHSMVADLQPEVRAPHPRICMLSKWLDAHIRLLFSSHCCKA